MHLRSRLLQQRSSESRVQIVRLFIRRVWSRRSHECFGLRLRQRLYSRHRFDSTVCLADELGKNCKGGKLHYEVHCVGAFV